MEDAKNAGRLLKLHGFEFDVVYTSWLVRAIETAWYCMDELDMSWLPMVKSWRLNEVCWVIDSSPYRLQSSDRCIIIFAFHSACMEP